ncbi:hypothetical protein Cgig2_018861 [Carnegiea gigantea]|uniref:Transposase n=1 Tax=Carnegiea gigantea TaxID=171969 RepID=A0A9Q1JML1_9CARY|nr:hypothetical protein Cgig2_018861 [Carnegiea gigantea]
MQPDLKPPTQPPSSFKVSKPLVQQPPTSLPSTQVPQPHQPITPLASEQTSKQPSILQSSIGVPQPATQPGSGILQPPTQPLRPPTASTKVVTRASTEAFQRSAEQTSKQPSVPQPSSGVPRPSTQPLRPPTASTKVVTRASAEAFQRSVEQTSKQPSVPQPSSGVPRPSTQPLRPPTASTKVVTRASATTFQRSAEQTSKQPSVPQPSSGVGRPTSLNGGSDSQPSFQPQSAASVAAVRPVQMPTSQTAAARPLVRSSTVTFGPFQPSSATIGSNPPCQPSSVIGTSQVGKGATQQEMHQKTGIPSQASRESPSNGNSEDLARTSPSQSIDKGKCHVGGKQKKTSMSKTTRSSRLSWKDNIQFDAKEEVLTVDDQGNEEVINGSILPRDVMNYKQGVRFCVAFNNYNQPIRKGGYIFVRFLGYIARLERFCPIGTISWHKLNKTYKADIVQLVRSKFIYPADKCFDKRVLKHVAKHFKQYKHGFKKDHFKPEQKTKEDMYELVPKGHSRDGWMRLVDYWCSKEHETLAEIGRDARVSQTHCHTTGSTSYAEKRADFVETHGREPTHLEFFKETHGKVGGGFVANTCTESFLNEASARVQERLLNSSPSKTQVEIENEVFDELMYEEENPKRPIGFGFNVDRNDVFGVNSILRKRGYIFPDNNMELKHVKEELASQKAMFLLMLKAVRDGKITDEFLDATKAALRMAGDQVSLSNPNVLHLVFRFIGGGCVG